MTDAKQKPTLVEQLRGATKLAIEATKSVTDVVEAMHQTIGAGPNLLGRPLERITKVLTAPAYGAVRGVTGLVGSGLDLALSKLAPVLEQSGVERNAVLSALNGVMGDYLAATGNPLAIDFELLAAKREGSRLVVLVHGSSMNDEQWLRHGHDHGAALRDALGLTPVYARYNSGLHISLNGKALAVALANLVAQWPVAVEELVIVGHSMGGLVARSAFAIAEEKGQAWRTVKKISLITLGTPHHGSPLERMGNWADVLLTISRYSAPLAKLGQLRSAGVTDLRYGNVLDSDWGGRDRFALEADTRMPLPLPAGVACLAIAATLSPTLSDNPAGDGLVPVESALGRSERVGHTLAFDRTWVTTGTTHLDLLSSRAVFDEVRGFLKPS